MSPQGVEGTIYGESAWIDVNNDGKQEIILCGASTNQDDYTVLIKNENDTLSLDTVTFTPLSLSSLSTGDFNNDGYMDFIMTGYNNSLNQQLTLLYLNNSNGGFTESTTSMAGVINGKIRNADLNNDGLLDVVITGLDTNYIYISNLYFQDNQGQFIEQSVNLMGNNFGDITIFDADNNGYQDILLTGFDTQYIPNSKLFLNNGGIFTHHVNAGISEFYFTGTSVADFDNDNDLDILITGTNSTYAGQTILYANDGSGVFTPLSTLNCENLYFGTADFIDGDNDGDFDLFISGQDGNGISQSIYYTNSMGTFTKDTIISDTIIGVSISSTDWADYDNDTDNGIW